MTGWELTKFIARNTNVYWRKLLVFALFLASFVWLGSWWQTQRTTEAAVNLPSSYTNQNLYQTNLAVEIKSNGKVLANGKDISQTLKILPDSYEIKILALDKPAGFISNFEATVSLPANVQKKDVKLIVYAIKGVESHQEYMVDSRTLKFVAENIYPSASYTMAVYLPKTILTPPLGKRITFYLTQMPVRDYLIIALALPLVTLLFLVFMVVKRWRDRLVSFGDKPISQAPDKIPPAMVGALVDGQIGAREIAATLIDLANRGYIYIIEKGETFSFGKRKSLKLEEMTELSPAERILLSKIFEPEKIKSTREDVEMRVGRHIFSRKVAQFYLETYNAVTRAGYFIKNPAIVHLRWKYSGIALYFLGFIGFFHNAFFMPDPKFTLIFWIGEMLVANLIIRFSGLMPVRSSLGGAKLREWLAFRRYLSLKQPIEPGESRMNRYMEYLPYAIVLGVEVEWSRRFFDERFGQPDWYDAPERVITIDRFVGGLFPLISFVGTILARSHEPTVE